MSRRSAIPSAPRRLLSRSSFRALQLTEIPSSDDLPIDNYEATSVAGPNSSPYLLILAELDYPLGASLSSLEFSDDETNDNPFRRACKVLFLSSLMLALFTSDAAQQTSFQDSR